MRRFLPLLLLSSASALAAPQVSLTQSPWGGEQPVQMTLNVNNTSNAPVTFGQVLKSGAISCPVFKLYDKAGGVRIEKYIGVECATGNTVTLQPGGQATYRVTLPFNDLKPGTYTAIMEWGVDGKTQYLRAPITVKK